MTNLVSEPLSNIYVRIYTGPDSQGYWRIPSGYIGIMPLFHLSDGEGWSARYLPLYYPAAATLDHASIVTVTNGINLTANAQLVALRDLTEHSYFPLMIAGNETIFPVDHTPDKSAR